MNELINISGQQFYTANIDQVIEQCSQKRRCALIIDKNYLADLLLHSKGLIGKSVNQIIVIGDNLNIVYPFFEGENVMLISAINFEEAMKISVFGAELSKAVVCVSDKEESELQEMLELISIKP